ncbi:HAD family hydrolase [Nakamurella sp. PAMC28650]|jgi:putative hydrolase of the HAD superfamily|uniref:HAD family hydrolase n=1 Tax=Nakamurella sp. PAMC28650 TaxID=2762325 RepID=UPI001C9B4CCC|nr:HAD family hydrolase [Nakamurella sp. PAMC28650]
MEEVADMDIQAIAFDVNGTLVQIWTDEHMEEIFRAAGHYLTYQGIALRRHQVRDRYFQIMKEQQKASSEKYPEFDAVRIWRQMIDENISDFTRQLPRDKFEQLPLFLAEMYRGISRRRLRLYPGVREMLDTLRGTMPMALVTDAQSAYARGELHKVGILDYFDPIVVSGDHGFRKPDQRLFQYAVNAMDVPAENTLYVGNDMRRDIYGARRAGLQTMMFDSDQGVKDYKGCVPDHRITDYRDLLSLLGR